MRVEEAMILNVGSLNLSRTKRVSCHALSPCPQYLYILDPLTLIVSLIARIIDLAFILLSCCLFVYHFHFLSPLNQRTFHCPSDQPGLVVNNNPHE